jgi:hypothetical protein
VPAGRPLLMVDGQTPEDLAGGPQSWG